MYFVTVPAGFALCAYEKGAAFRTACVAAFRKSGSAVLLVEFSADGEKSFQRHIKYLSSLDSLYNYGNLTYLYCPRTFLPNSYRHIKKAMLLGIEYRNCPALLKTIEVQETIVVLNIKGYGELLARSVLYP
jgi:hypothetical protein